MFQQMFVILSNPISEATFFENMWKQNHCLAAFSAASFCLKSFEWLADFCLLDFLFSFEFSAKTLTFPAECIFILFFNLQVFTKFTLTAKNTRAQFFETLEIRDLHYKNCFWLRFL